MPPPSNCPSCGAQRSLVVQLLSAAYADEERAAAATKAGKPVSAPKCHVCGYVVTPNGKEAPSGTST